jgi:hypothetical protein
MRLSNNKILEWNDVRYALFTQSRPLRTWLPMCLQQGTGMSQRVENVSMCRFLLRVWCIIWFKFIPYFNIWKFESYWSLTSSTCLSCLSGYRTNYFYPLNYNPYLCYLAVPSLEWHSTARFGCGASATSMRIQTSTQRVDGTYFYLLFGAQRFWVIQTCSFWFFILSF